MNISIIIPNYNGEGLLKRNLPKVYDEVKEDKGIVEIIVADDFSTDDSLKVLEKLKKEIPLLKILTNKSNLGFSKNVNKAVRQAKGELLILLNSDVSPERGFLKPLLKHFSDEKVFAVGCMDKSYDNGKVILRGRGLGKWEKGFLLHRRGEVDKTNTLWVSGGSGAFSKKIWEKLDGFNEIYSPFYWEDIDISYRALKSGYKLIFEPESIVNHEHEKGAIKSKYSESYIKTISYRNQFIFSWENATDLSIQVSFFFWLPYHLLKAVLRMDTPFFKGFFWALILSPKVIKSSLAYQRQFTKKDSEVIKGYLE